MAAKLAVLKSMHPNPPPLDQPFTWTLRNHFPGPPDDGPQPRFVFLDDSICILEVRETRFTFWFRACTV